MCRENRRNLNFTFNFIDGESRPRFHCCFMFTASNGKIVLRFGKFTCITGGTLVSATAVYAPVVASVFQNIKHSVLLSSLASRHWSSSLRLAETWATSATSARSANREHAYCK
jgi:hypothetical protein